MPTYQAFDPQSEMNGRTALGMVKSILHDDIAEILVRHHLNDIDPDAWYRVQDLLEVFNEVAQQRDGGNSSSIFVSIGMGAADIGFEGMPPQLKSMSLEEFLAAYPSRLSVIHHGDVGYVKYEKLNENHFVMTMNVPYPDDMMYGVFYGYARHLKPKGQSPSVAYDNRQPRRDKGGEVTILHITLHADSGDNG